MRAKQSPNESAQSGCIEQNAFKTFRRRRHEIDVVVVALQKLRRVRICARRHEIEVFVVASAKAQTCAHLRTLDRALATQ